MTTLITESRFYDPDLAYRALIDAHRGLSDEQSAALNSRLVLILANHIGDQAVLQGALALAKQSMEQPECGAS
jgi:predicted metal-dependent hydrolase